MKIMKIFNNYKQPKYSIGAYDVAVIKTGTFFTTARLEIAQQKDMPSSGGWSFNWKRLWEITNFDYQSIIKISYNNSVLGLIRYAVYVSSEGTPYSLEILQLESAPKNLKLVAPLGKWLIWYAVETALKFCIPDEDGTLVSLDSLEDAIAYYRDIIGMEPRGCVTIAPGEEGHAFRFIEMEARSFCQRQRNIYGQPTSI